MKSSKLNQLENLIYIICLFIGLFCMATPLQAGDWHRVLSLNGKWKFTIGDDLNWSEPDCNDRDWETVNVPDTWESQGFHGYNGYAWYRRSFQGYRMPENKSLYLFMGYIDDVDEVYFNGHLIGRSGSFPPHLTTAYHAYRRYPIPADLVNHDGENVIAVRVYDSRLGGGIVSGDIGVFYKSGEFQTELDFRGLWKFSTGDRFEWKSDSYDDSHWDEIMVPSAWEDQGYWKYDGIAWYRLQFSIPPSMNKDELLLVCGKIDDFDQIYLDGKLLGTTKDYRRFGNSQSYSELRVYPLPQLESKNRIYTLAVRVEDIGHVGGIYRGPVGIIRKSYWENISYRY